MNFFEKWCSFCLKYTDDYTKCRVIKCQNRFHANDLHSCWNPDRTCYLHAGKSSILFNQDQLLNTQRRSCSHYKVITIDYLCEVQTFEDTTRILIIHGISDKCHISVLENSKEKFSKIKQVFLIVEHEYADVIAKTMKDFKIYNHLRVYIISSNFYTLLLKHLETQSSLEHLVLYYNLYKSIESSVQDSVIMQNIFTVIVVTKHTILNYNTIKLTKLPTSSWMFFCYNTLCTNFLDQPIKFYRFGSDDLHGQKIFKCQNCSTPLRTIL